MFEESSYHAVVPGYIAQLFISFLVLFEVPVGKPVFGLPVTCLIFHFTEASISV